MGVKDQRGPSGESEAVERMKSPAREQERLREQEAEVRPGQSPPGQGPARMPVTAAIEVEADVS